MTFLRKEAPTCPPPHREHQPADTGSQGLATCLLVGPVLCSSHARAPLTRPSPPHPPTTGNRLKLRPQADSVSLLPHAACLSPSVVGVPPAKRRLCRPGSGSVPEEPPSKAVFPSKDAPPAAPLVRLLPRARHLRKGGASAAVTSQ